MQGPPAQLGPIFHATNPLPRLGALKAPTLHAENSMSALATAAAQSVGGITSVHFCVGVGAARGCVGTDTSAEPK